MASILRYRIMPNRAPGRSRISINDENHPSDDSDPKGFTKRDRDDDHASAGACRRARHYVSVFDDLMIDIGTVCLAPEFVKDACARRVATDGFARKVRDALGAFHFLTKRFSDATIGWGRTGPTRSNGAGPVDRKLSARPELARNP
ncbi:hypothetical protein ACFOMH_06760 [Paracoccus mangrovi]|uniref:Uncharacterized protein n=1 Tax=Paracoccus mangrovi TaxID=1715645 RepID=A0ABV7R0H7_9RHOB